MAPALILAAALAAASPPRAQGQDLSRWYQGPVRYLLTRREEKEFRSLDDDAERSEFIRSFWKHRDPIPETAENEARISFWRRVVESNRLFNDSALPGWKTDRGKIYILLGPPTDIEEDNNYDTGDRTTSGRGLLRWHYEGALKRGTGIGTSVIIPFVRGGDGAWYISSSAKFSSLSFNPMAPENREIASLARIQSGLDYGPTDLGVALDQGMLESPPWQEKDFIERITSEAYLGALPIQARFDFFRASDGGAFAVVTCAVPLSAFSAAASAPTIPDVTVVARLSPAAGSPGGIIDLDESAFTPSPTNARASRDEELLFQARTPLGPGHYDVYIGLFERIRLQAANLKTRIDVPDFSAPITLSDIALGRSLRRVPEGTGGYKRPYRISDFELIPAVSAVYKSGETFSALWQIYDDGPEGPGSGLQVSSQFYQVTDAGDRPIGKPSVVEDADKVQGWSSELKGWPPGSYRFEVTAKNHQGHAVSRSVLFRIAS